MRRALAIATSTLALLVLAVASPGVAQTTSTSTTIVTPGQVDALLITGSVVCTPTHTYEVTWTLQNVSETAIGFISAYTQTPGGPQVPVELASIPAGTSSTLVSTFPGTTSGQTVLQTEAFFEPDTATGGPVPGSVVLDGLCVAPVVAPVEVSPNFTG